MDLLGGLDRGQEGKGTISRRTLYDEYKRATTSFKEGMASLVPSLGMNVHSLVEAADSLADSNRHVSPNLLRTLRSAIRIRQRVALLYDDVAGGRDPGHEYFVKVLQYCYQRLKPLTQSDTTIEGQAASAAKVSDDNVAEVSNKFHALSTEEDDDNAEDDMETDDKWEETKVERPEEPEVDYSINDDLIEGSDCFLATSFLDTINLLLGEVASSYANLKTICQQPQQAGEEKPLLGFELMKCAVVVANAAIQELRYHEQVLIEERPHLNSFYRILAAALLPDTIYSLMKEMN